MLTEDDSIGAIIEISLEEPSVRSDKRFHDRNSMILIEIMTFNEVLVSLIT